MRHAKNITTAGAWLLAIVIVAAGPTTRAEDNTAGRVTVSGISAGGYAAVQTHIALSDIVSGAAVIAAGPYHCAEGNLVHALGRCINGASLDAAPLVEAAREAANAGEIDALEALADDRVWLFHGQSDPVVNARVTGALRDFYAAFVPEEAIVMVDDIPATHGWPTLESGIACAEMGGDFINDCDYDAAGTMLQHLYGPLQARTDAREDNLQVLDQAAMREDGAGFAESGFAYVPGSCADEPGECLLHIAFHGCRQGKEFIEDRFARMSGLNEWAESNRIVVLYPQIEKSMMNPQGCWDWWGYTGPDYDRRQGLQIAGIAALIASWSSASAR
jgi:poly(3-hydroxybutyrate) depolymerase